MCPLDPTHYLVSKFSPDDLALIYLVGKPTVFVLWGLVSICSLFHYADCMPRDNDFTAVSSLPPKLRMVVFDLDDTLAPSKSALPDEMVVALRNLLQVCEVCVISGGAFSQFDKQVLQRLDFCESEVWLAQRLHLMPTCGTRYYRFDGDGWKQIYALDLSADQKRKVLAVLECTAKELGLWSEHSWGEIIEDRGSQITFSALGQQAPLAAKRAWDPDGAKKRDLAALVSGRLPDLEVRGGGSTSIDVTRPGVDKAFGMKKLAEQTGIARTDTIFVGDRLDPDGNDYPVSVAGWSTIAVSNWMETISVIDHLIAIADL